MLKGASRGALKFIEQELYEAWRQGRQEGRREFVVYAVPEIISARFGPGVRDAARSVAELSNDDRLEELIALAVTCLDFNSFYYQAVMPKRKRRV
jgi:hypothetical protein